MTTVSSVDPLLAALRSVYPEPEEKAEDPPPQVTPPEPRRWLFVASPPPPPPLSPMKRIKVMVARDYDVSVRALESNIRTAGVVLPRQIIMYLAKRYAHASLPAIGRVLGGRDHTTVLHGVKRIEARLASGDLEFTERINKLVATIFPRGEPHDTYR